MQAARVGASHPTRCANLTSSRAHPLYPTTRAHEPRAPPSRAARDAIPVAPNGLVGVDPWGAQAATCFPIFHPSSAEQSPSIEHNEREHDDQHSRDAEDDGNAACNVGAKLTVFGS